MYRVPVRSSSRSSPTMVSSSSSSSISCSALAGIAPASTAGRSAWYRGESFFDGCVVTIGLAPRSSSPASTIPLFLSFPTSARPYVAARVVEYAMAINVNRPPRMTVPIRAVAPSPTSGGQQPPNDVIDFDYWIHRLTTPAETLSKSAALPPPLPVFDKTSSRVSPRFITSYWMCFVFQMYLCFEDGPLTGFH